MKTVLRQRATKRAKSPEKCPEIGGAIPEIGGAGFIAKIQGQVFKVAHYCVHECQGPLVVAEVDPHCSPQIARVENDWAPPFCGRNVHGDLSPSVDALSRGPVASSLSPLSPSGLDGAKQVSSPSLSGELDVS